MGIRKSFTFEGQRYFIRAADETDFEVKKALKIKELEDNPLIVRKNVTVKQWATDWADIFRPGVGPTRKKQITRTINLFCETYGNYPISKITQKNVQMWFNGSGIRNKGTFMFHRSILHSFFESALKNGLITINPTKDISPSNLADPHQRRSITPLERAVILQVADYHPLGVFVKIMLYAGLRNMEVAALNGEDVDLKRRILHVRCSCAAGGERKPPKTSAGIRDIPISDPLYEALKDIKPVPFQPYLTTKSGRRFSNNSVSKMWVTFKKEMNKVKPFSVAPDLTLYCLRHTFCTDLQNAGVPINVAKTLMGHTSITMTSKVYTHYTDETLENARVLMDNFARKDTVPPPCHVAEKG